MFEKKTPMIGLLALLLSSGLSAQAEDMPLEPPPLPARVESGQTMEPEVTIVQGQEHTVHEYRIHGRLYAIKIVSKDAPPYYLVDTDGDGRLEHRTDSLADEFLVPQWVLFSW